MTQNENKSLHSSGSIQPGVDVVQTFHAMSVTWARTNQIAQTVSSVYIRINIILTKKCLKVKLYDGQYCTLLSLNIHYS